MSQGQSSAGGNPPAFSIRKHGLKATVWRNETRNGALYNVTLVRTYRDGEEFKDTTSLGFDDLANAAKLLLDAESWITGAAPSDKLKMIDTHLSAPRREKGPSRGGCE